ncbi:unnamed protein product [Candida verbasci]|uniref:Dopey N-terminal domain-containing protein n=1 Tax=Candida verbasci TaxID=1227364 RepID=A0A9W4XBW4_9ASCO|nr:unnamed protein product [Candida verbasci]
MSKRKTNSLLKRIKERKETSQLSSRDKKYYQQIEKALTSFENLEEWADYISFLSKLFKSLQYLAESKNEDSFYIPYSDQVSFKLSLCVSPNLPNGVHQKALSIYEYIFNNLPNELLNEEIHLWLNGLLPLLSYASISVKPQILQLYKHLLFEKLNNDSLKRILQPILLCLFSGLDDENSEVFDDVFELLDNFKKKINDDSQFWQNIFICIINNSERRIGALNWCSRRLPRFITTKDSNGNAILSAEAQLCLTPEAGLLARSFSVAVDPFRTIDVVVVRGFFDLLLSHIPLDSEIMKSTITPKDKELLIMSCPDNQSNSLSLTKSEYFEKFAANELIESLLKLICSDDIKESIVAFKISLPLIMDKWEISRILTPKLYGPLLNSLFHNSNNEELMAVGLSFFNDIEPFYIWADIFKTLLNDDENMLNIVEFVLKEFSINEEDSVVLHAPFAMIALLANTQITSKKIELIQMLIKIIPKQLYIIKLQEIDLNQSDVLKHIDRWYSAKLENEDPEIPYSKEVITSIILRMVENIYLDNINNETYCIPFAMLLSNLWSELSIEDQNWRTDLFIEKILSIWKSKSEESELISSLRFCVKFLKSSYEAVVYEDILLKSTSVIFVLLEKAHNLKLNLNLLHVEESKKEPILINLIALGIDKCVTSELLQNWISLLIKCLYLFEDSVFSVLFNLNEVLLKKLSKLFNTLSSWEAFNDDKYFENSIYILFDGLEDLLSISHSYILSSNYKHQNERQNNHENGFLNTMIQGVFQIESPTMQNNDQNVLYSVLMAIHDAVDLSYRIWVWSDSNHTLPINSELYSERSMIYIAHKLKFRTKKLLECLMSLERREVTETLIEVTQFNQSTIKLLNILDGGRSQRTVVSLYNSIIIRCKSDSAQHMKNTLLVSKLSAKDVSNFLVAFFEYVDNDVILDVWESTTDFLKSVINNSENFDIVCIDSLKISQRIASNFDEFNLSRWLFVSTGSNVVKEVNVENSNSLIDTIASLHDFTILKDDPLPIDQSTTSELRPLLGRIKNIDSITQLRLYFESLSLISYERSADLESNLIWWPSHKWAKLKKIVISNQIGRVEAINSSLLMKELECGSKQELKTRYDFLLTFMNQNK